MTKKATQRLEELQFFGEFGGVNPSISDSSTYTFLAAKTMQDTFDGNTEGCYLYSRHSSPSNLYLGEALAALENTEAAVVTSSGMAAITETILQICSVGDHIVSSRTVYGGTYSFLNNFLPKFQIHTSFVDITDLESVENAIQSNTKIVYCETVSNPLLEIANLPELAKIANRHDIIFIVDNTFTPFIITPKDFGAHIIIHSLTKFINGSSDTIGGAICANKEFITDLKSVDDGASMLLGGTLDSLRASSLLKNLQTLPIRIKQHSKNALYVATTFEELGLAVTYPGLETNRNHELMQDLYHYEFGFGGLLTIDVGDILKANEVMERMQDEKIGFLAVSLGYYKTLFSAPGSSTSSEIPEEEQKEMGLSKGLIRFSIGLDFDIKNSTKKMISCFKKVGVI